MAKLIWGLRGELRKMSRVLVWTLGFGSFFLSIGDVKFSFRQDGSEAL